MQNLVADVVKREYTLMRALNPKRLSLPHGKPRWNERLLWEHITPSSNGSITTLPLDAPLKQWPTKSRNIPLLRFEKVATDVAGSIDLIEKKSNQQATLTIALFLKPNIGIGLEKQLTNRLRDCYPSFRPISPWANC